MSDDGIVTPNCFILGAPKSGTTTLASWLAEHPSVFASNPKEPFFFCSDFPDLKHQHGLETLDDYRQLFSAARPEHSVVLEASTNYLRSVEAVPAILRLVPDARFIVMLRDPTEIAHAFHMEQVFGLNEPESDFAAAWSLQETRQVEGEPGSTYPDFLQYRQVASIGSQLARCSRLITTDKLHVVFLEDLRDNPKSSYTEVQEFLDLRPMDVPEVRRANPSRRHRSKLLARVVLEPPDLLSPTIRSIRRRMNQSDSVLLERVKSYARPAQSRSPLDPMFAARLRSEFSEEVQRVEQLTGRVLDHWK